MRKVCCAIYSDAMTSDELTNDRTPSRWGRLHDYLFGVTADRVGLTRELGETLRAPYLR